MDLMLSTIPGLAIAAGLYFLYLVATKGLPAALAWVKGKWTSGKAELAKLDDDIDHAFERIGVLEKQMVSVLAARAFSPTVAPAPTPPASMVTLQPAPAPAAVPAATLQPAPAPQA